MDEKPDARTQVPPDPFGPLHANRVQILEAVRGFRKAGAGLIEAAVIVAAQLAVIAAGGEAQGGQQ
jgi:hypothetical protein